MANLEEFKKDTEETIKKNPDGCLIFDISLRYGSIETDIISVAENYGFDPEWTEEEKKIIEENENADTALCESGFEWLNGVSDDAESYLNDLLSQVGIEGYWFCRISENEIWGLFPTWIDMDETEKTLNAFWEYYRNERKLSEEYTIEDIEIESYDLYGLTVLSIDGEEYAIGTESEVDKAAEETIKDTLCYFNPEWVQSHLEIDLPIEAIKAIQEKYEEGSLILYDLFKRVGDWDYMVRDSILADGRGHFLSSYDGKEEETYYASEWYYIYRLN